MATGLLFSGQGAQHVGMGKTLYEGSQVARELFDQAGEVLGFDLAKACFEGPEDLLTQTKVCQPALYVHGYAIFSILKDAGKLDDFGVSLGLSLGELTALAAAGAFDFATGLKTVAERGRLMQDACEKTEGSMACVIGGTREVVEELCEACGVEVANLNCPGQIVISGDKDKVGDAVGKAKEFKDKGVRLAKPLNVAGAYHSKLMEPARKAFETYLEGVEIKKPEVPVFTNTTGGQVEEPADIRSALAKQVVSSVMWEDCMRAASELGFKSFYECGPGAVLSGLAKRIDKEIKVTSLSNYEDLPL